jgi:hypothetical protein
MFTRASGMTGKRRLVAVGLSALGLTTLIAVLAVTFMALNAHTAFGSGSGGGGCISTSGPVCTFNGNQAYVDFSSVSADGCTFTDANVQVFDNVTRPGGVTTSQVIVFISVWNNCTGQPVVEASNFDPNTGVPEFNGTYSFGSKMSSAIVNGTAPMYDYVSNTNFTSTVNVTLQGYGPTSQFSDTNSYRSPGFFSKSRFKGVSRNAEASGTVTDASNNNLAAGASIYANINSNSGGTLQIIKL